MNAEADTNVVQLRDRKVIPLRGGELDVYVAEAEQLLASDVYVRGRQLVRPGTAPELAVHIHRGLQRQHDQYVIVPVTPEWMRQKLTARAEFQREDRRARKWVTVDCPRDLAANIAGSGEWPRFRPLDAIATAPFLRADRTVCDTPGYDPTSRVFYAPNQEFPKVPERPLREDALRALQDLLDPFHEFPFATDEAKAAFVSHVLTTAGRSAIDTTPAYVYTAPLAGTGKTLLASMPHRIADGVPPAVRPYVDESEELRKVLFAAVLAGDNGLMFDNVPSGAKLRSPTLCGFVTADVYADRRLGASESSRLPNRCTVVLTGNNLTPAADFARRSIIVRLDANRERVYGREFRIPNLAAHVAEHRPKLLLAALTIIRAYALAAPRAERPLPSFESWSRIARDPLRWLGCPDPVLTQDAEADDELEPLREAFAHIAQWMQVLANGPFTAREIAAQSGRFEGDALRDAINAAGCADSTSAQKVGYWLRANRDRVAGPWKLKQCGEAHKVAKWTLLRQELPL